MIRSCKLAALMLLMATASVFAQSKSDVEALKARFMAAFNQGSGEGVAALYTKNAKLLPDRAPRIDGQEAITEYWKVGVKQVGNLVLGVQDVMPLSPDTIACIGTWQLKTKGDNPQVLGGKDLVIYQKEGDDWKIIADIWNTDTE
jgi:uncharacterized protein (TIGR02246 family)